jgi:hypothetical protein
MSGAGGDGDGAGVNKKPRLMENENDHAVSMMQTVRIESIQILRA